MTDPSNDRPDEVPTGRPRVPDEDCLRCGASLESLGFHKFRTGGSTGSWKLLFGELAELGEDMFPFEVLACVSCNHVEFRLPAGGG